MKPTPSYNRFSRLKSVSMLANGIGIETVIRFWYLFVLVFMHLQ